jgi:hypothetical protein
MAVAAAGTAAEQDMNHKYAWLHKTVLLGAFTMCKNVLEINTMTVELDPMKKQVRWAIWPLLSAVAPQELCPSCQPCCGVSDTRCSILVLQLP